MHFVISAQISSSQHLAAVALCDSESNRLVLYNHDSVVPVLKAPPRPDSIDREAKMVNIQSTARHNVNWANQAQEGWGTDSQIYNTLYHWVRCNMRGNEPHFWGWHASKQWSQLVSNCAWPFRGSRYHNVATLPLLFGDSVEISTTDDVLADVSTVRLEFMRYLSRLQGAVKLHSLIADIGKDTVNRKVGLSRDW